MIIRKHFLIPLFLLCFAFANSQSYASEKAVFSLTPEEKAWLAEHPEISMGIMDSNGAAASADLAIAIDRAMHVPLGDDYPLVINLSLGWPPEFGVRSSLRDSDGCVTWEDPIGEAVRTTLYEARERDETTPTAEIGRAHV